MPGTEQSEQVDKRPAAEPATRVSTGNSHNPMLYPRGGCVEANGRAGHTPDGEQALLRLRLGQLGKYVSSWGATALGIYETASIRKGGWITACRSTDITSPNHVFYGCMKSWVAIVHYSFVA